jgi:hypothetical protein
LWEARHVDADLGDEDLGGGVADSGCGRQDFDFGTKGLDGRAHLLVDGGNGALESLDLVQVQLEQEAMMLPDVASQYLQQRAWARLQSRGDSLDQRLRVGLSGDELLQDRPAAPTDDVADHRGDLEIGSSLWDALDVLALRARVVARCVAA